MKELEALIEGCKKANPKAQRAILDAYASLLFSVALRYAIDRAEAKDITQESWIKIFNNIGSYSHEGKFEGWIKRITINCALRRRSGLIEKKSTYVDTFFEPPTEDPVVISNLNYDDLIKIVNMLPDIGREVFKMHAIDGLKHKEIGELLRIEESTSRAHLTRAKKKLREYLLQLEMTPHGK